MSTDTPPAGDRSIVSKLGPVAWLGLIASTLPPLGSIVLLARIEAISGWLRQHEAYGPIVYTTGFWFLAGLALLPTYAIAVLGGWAFGPVVGLTCAMIGFTGASAIAYAVARYASGDRVQQVLAGKPKWNIIAKALFGSSPGKTFLIITLLRLPPNSPFALTNLLLATLRVPIGIYLLGTCLGMLPRTAIVVYAASRLQQLSFESGADWRWITVGVIVTVGVMLILWQIARTALERVTRVPQT